MPIYLYKTIEKGCPYCKEGFEILQKVDEEPLRQCPKCKSRVKKVLCGFSIGFSKTSFERKAKEKGFHKLKKVDKGKYEKIY